jgi:hypothetical protein
MTAGCSGSGTATATPASRQALPAGTYASTTFRPVATFTLPAGWLITEDSAELLALQPVTSDSVGIYVFRSPRAASQQADCPTAAAPDVGSKAKDLVDWIAALPGLAAGERTSVAVGGLAGFQVDVSIAAGWTASCPFADGLPTVPLLVGGSSGLRWVVAGSERLRLSVLDVPAGGTVVVDVDAFDGTLFDGFLPVAAPIVEGLRFAAL